MSAAPARRRRRRRRLRWVPAVLLLVVVFGLGIALGEALHDNPKPGGGQTIMRTLILSNPAPTATSGTTTTPKP